MLELRGSRLVKGSIRFCYVSCCALCALALAMYYDIYIYVLVLWSMLYVLVFYFYIMCSNSVFCVLPVFQTSFVFFFSEGLNEVRPAVYRTAMKLRSLQKLCHSECVCLNEMLFMCV